MLESKILFRELKHNPVSRGTMKSFSKENQYSFLKYNFQNKKWDVLKLRFYSIFFLPVKYRIGLKNRKFLLTGSREHQKPQKNATKPQIRP